VGRGGPLAAQRVDSPPSKSPHAEPLGAPRRPPLSTAPRMKIHEFQAKQLLERFGLAVPKGRECKSVDEVVRAYGELGGGLCVVKAQIHAGGRGKAGGVKLVRS